MAKKSRSSVKAESQVSTQEETSEAEMNIPAPSSGGIVEFVYLFGGLAILMTIAMIVYLINQYVFHFL